MKRFVPSFLMWPLMLLALLTWNPVVAAREITDSGGYEAFHGIGREPDVLKILSVLEGKIKNQKSLVKAREKLLNLKESEFALITSLSEQITKEGETPAVDIAFLLITALIILS